MQSGFTDYHHLRLYNEDSRRRFQEASEERLAQDAMQANLETVAESRRAKFTQFINRVWLALFHRESEAPQPVHHRRKAYDF